MRKPSACAACRARRRKCQTREGLIDCIYCNERGIKCDQRPPEGGYYEQRENQRKERLVEERNTSIQQRSSYHAAGSASSGSQAGGGWCTRCETTPHAAALPSLPVRLDLVRLYFDYIHDQFHSLFHRPSFIEDALGDRVHHGILFGICALSARFSTDPEFADVDPRDRSHAYIRAAEGLLNLRDVSLPTIQLCVLIGAALTANGDGESENIYYGVACRMAQLLNLPGRPATNLLEREINIRGMIEPPFPIILPSATFICNSLLQGTNSKLTSRFPSLVVALHDRRVVLHRGEVAQASPGEIRYPLADGRSTVSLVEPPHRGRSDGILLDVNDFNQRCVADNPTWDALEQGVESLSRRMEDWLAALPANMRDTPENFSWFAARGQGRTFAAVYLGYYHFGQLLYYQFLYGAATTTAINPTASASVARRDLYAKRCKEHAAQLCDMVYRAQTTPGSDVRYTMTAHVLVIASTVQIHTLLFSGDEADISVARRRLERNFELLMQLRCYWPTTDRAISRLRAFHQTARTSIDTSFVLDRWMLRFLVEFAEPMEEKERGDGEEMESLWMDGPR
ncbi:ZnF3 [Colletotrichum salicis]|uniref:ZnF3 n=1 Tax=Colletotrichum salicis TaxID=1209931 RepID=A0A135SCZ4_9PEZI|nr:ZnF3 [Colletotrichum salicis]